MSWRDPALADIVDDLYDELDANLAAQADLAAQQAKLKQKVMTQKEDLKPELSLVPIAPVPVGHLMGDTKKKFASRCYHRVRSRCLKRGHSTENAYARGGQAHDIGQQLWDIGIRENHPKQLKLIEQLVDGRAHNDVLKEIMEGV